MAHRKQSEKTQQHLKTIVSHFEKEDVAVRERQIRTWRRLKLFWEGFQNVWYSEVAHDWRIWDEQQDQDTDQSYYDKKVNVFRAYLESIIAALSVTVPPVKCYPDDADNPLDLSTAKAGDKIAELIFRHNDLSLLWLHALFIYCTEGMVACYTYAKEDKEFGTWENNEYEDKTEVHDVTTCPSCNFPIDTKELTPEEAAIPPSPQIPQTPIEQQPEIDFSDEFAPGEDELDSMTQQQEPCPSCGAMITPNVERKTFVVTRLVGTTNDPKSRVMMEAYGGLNVKIPNYARTQAECPYLIYAYETHYANALEKYDILENTELIKKIRAGGGGGLFDAYEQWGRLSPQYQNQYPVNSVTIRHCWLRPAAFNVLGDEEDVKEMKKKFPNGVKVTLVNDEYADACEESLDDHWTLTRNPLSDYVHYDPLGLLLTSIQEITNDLLSLTLQTIEHGIGQTFADPNVVNFNAYSQTEVLPGGIFPATPKSGKSLNDGFHELKTATLSSEVLPFTQSVQSMGQLVSGALPSLFGGTMPGSGETASQYSMSRAQALQRLQNTWKMLTIWWKTSFGKAIPMYIKELKEDEKDVKRNTDGSFVNVFIRKADVEGKIGKIELEANENLPLTWSQKKDTIMQLLTVSNPEVAKILAAPENLDIIREAIGLNDLYVPGEDDREKQYEEIQQLLNSEPIQMPPDQMMIQEAMTMGQQPPEFIELPSVDIDPLIDNNIIEYEICRKWLISEAGRLSKTDNPQGYKNVLLHAKLHLNAIQIPPMAEPQGKGAVPSEKPNDISKKTAPITGESDVQTTS